jgi:AcrR family transcriptional regulator
VVKTVKRRYDMANRGRQALETRRQIVEAAADLFIRDGYAATSIASIAEKACVAVPTVYASVGGKAELLRAVTETTIRGDDDATPMAVRAEWLAIEAEADPLRKLRAFARFHRGICDREALVFAQIEAAAGADRAAADLLAEHDRGRYDMQESLARTLAARKSLRPALNAKVAADVIWTLASERTYLALVRDRGWTPDRYEEWLFDQLVAALLP